MSDQIESHLREAFTRQAASTTTSPDPWRRFEARRTGASRQFRAARVVLVPGLAVLVLAVLVVAVRRDEGNRVRVAGPVGRLYLTPSGIDGRYRLVSAVTDPDLGRQPARTARIFGRRAPDGVTFAASIAVNVPGTDQPQVVGPGSETLRVGADDLAVHRDLDGRRTLSWQDAGGLRVGLTAFGVTDAELVAAAESLRPGPATAAAVALPTGFEPVFSGVLPAGFRFTDQTWEADDGRSFNLTVAEVPGASLDAVAWESPLARSVPVRGTTGLHLAPQHALTWIERPGTAVTVSGPELGYGALQDLAAGLRPIDEAAWRRLAATAENQEPPRAGGPALVVASGQHEGARWEARVSPDPGVVGGTCLELVHREVAATVCAPASMQAGSVARIGGTPAFLLAAAGREVEAARVAVADRPPLSAAVVRTASGAVGFLVVPLPTGARPTAVVALDAAGRELSTTAVPVTPTGP